MSKSEKAESSNMVSQSSQSNNENPSDDEKEFTYFDKRENKEKVMANKSTQAQEEWDPENDWILSAIREFKKDRINCSVEEFEAMIEYYMSVKHLLQRQDDNDSGDEERPLDNSAKAA